MAGPLMEKSRFSLFPPPLMFGLVIVLSAGRQAVMQKMHKRWERRVGKLQSVLNFSLGYNDNDAPPYKITRGSVLHRP